MNLMTYNRVQVSDLHIQYCINICLTEQDCTADISYTCIDITDLDDVIDSLQHKQFTSTHWKELGLQLGLYMPTLDEIDDKCRGNPRKCLQECLAAWLRKEDKVTSKGGPTWTSLATALDKIGEHKVASDIRR